MPFFSNPSIYPSANNCFLAVSPRMLQSGTTIWFCKVPTSSVNTSAKPNAGKKCFNGWRNERRTSRNSNQRERMVKKILCNVFWIHMTFLVVFFFAQSDQNHLRDIQVYKYVKRRRAVCVCLFLLLLTSRAINFTHSVTL